MNVPGELAATQSREGLWPAWEFAVHVVVGGLIFASIAGAAFALELLDHYLETAGIDPFVHKVLKAGEYSVAVVDLSLFLIFLLKTAARAARRF